MPLTVSTTPENDPLDRTELKRHLNLEGTTRFDTYLDLLIAAIVTPAQRHLGKQLIKATLVWTIKKFSQFTELPRPPLIELATVEYRDENGVWQTVAGENYEVNTDAEPGFVRFIDDFDIPDTYDDEVYPWRFTYDAGYVDDQGASNHQQVPAELRLWMMNIIGSYFMKREDMVLSNRSVDVAHLEQAMGRLISAHKKAVRFG